MSKPTLVIIEDEPELLEILHYNLSREGFEVLTASDGHDGLQQVQACLPDLVILDLMLPVLDGLEVCKRLRGDSATEQIPVLMLTAKGQELDEVTGFQMGADDYVTKPFKMQVLIQRIKALLRRAAADQPETVTIFGLEIHRFQHRVRLQGKPLQLTPTEFRLLWTMACQPGRAFHRQELMDASMGQESSSMERTIDVHVKALRQKLGSQGDLIETVRGVGYRFRDRPLELVGSGDTRQTPQKLQEEQ